VSMEKMRSSLQGKRAIVTGASSGAGWATVKALAAEGVKVMATARREERLQALQAEVIEAGGHCIYSVGDAGASETASAVLDATLEHFGGVDILINNAGQGNYKPLVDTSIEEYDELMQSNMRSSFLFTRAVVPHFIAQRSGVLVFVSSVAGLAGAANEAVYSASKFAQVGFAQSLDHELRPHGIKVSTLCPGGMKTEFAVGRGRLATDVGNSRMMEASDFADSIVFVCMQPANVRLPLLTVRHMG
jgi:short-subunit dehydrogenase